jgi:hypothetical protein
MKTSRITDGAPVKHGEEMKLMKERLRRCLQLLKMNHDERMRKTAFELIEKSNDFEGRSQHWGWITALNAIAGSCLLNQRAFSQSEVYDFLTIAVTTSLEGRTKAIDELIFRVYRDIMATYESMDAKSKIAFPKIIVDVVAILGGGVDTSGKRTPIHNVEVYYQTRKSDVNSIISVTPSTTSITTATAASIESIEEDMKVKKPTLSNDEESELVDILNKITERKKEDIKASIAKLERRDILRIKDLCKNYSKIQKYSKLIADTDNLRGFKTALQNESGRKLSSFQIQHAANSVRKAKLYLENVLDGKFIPRGSYGINHTKHNLEYGYLIVGLMESSRKRITSRRGSA